MVTERLKAAMTSAAHLSPEAQDKVAAQLERAIGSVMWDADLNDPRNDAWLREWIAQARQDETVDFPSPMPVAGAIDSPGRPGSTKSVWHILAQ